MRQKAREQLMLATVDSEARLTCPTTARFPLSSRPARIVVAPSSAGALKMSIRPINSLSAEAAGVANSFDLFSDPARLARRGDARCAARPSRPQSVASGRVDYILSTIESTC